MGRKWVPRPDVLTRAWQTATGMVSENGAVSLLRMRLGGWTVADAERIFALARCDVMTDGEVSRFLRTLYLPEDWAERRLDAVSAFLVSRAQTLVRTGHVSLAEALDWLMLYPAMPDRAARVEFERASETPEWQTWREVTPVSVAVLGYAAGLTAKEVLAASDGGDLDVTGFRALAGLRGYRLPTLLTH